jgi:ribonucleoside-triphosphate reductase
VSQLGLNPSRDAGKFAYHLRTLLKAGLVDVDKESKKYGLTVLGNIMIGFSQDIEEHILREEGKLLVRTSRLAMEEFDRNKIAQALNREAGIPSDLAQRIAEETEERLLKLDTLHLTAPLIREFVNAILVEKGLQEYRHKHARLGLPVYDITNLFENAESSSTNVIDIQSVTGKTMMRDYVFLNILPRRVANGHLSGNLHVNNADSWIIKPEEVQHDLRVFLQNGLRINSTDSSVMATGPPKSIESALRLTEAIIHASRMEIVGEQGLNHFNIFLAPFVKGMFLEDLRRVLKRFVFSLSYIASRKKELPTISLNLDFTIPEYLKKVKAIGVNGERIGYYDEYFEEAVKILMALLDVMFEDDDRRPIFTPHLIFNLTKEDLISRELEAPLFKAHELASKFGTPYFINSSKDWQKKVAYFSSGNRLATDWMGDWELDTMRTGSLGTISLNLPRLAYESPRDNQKFIRGLNSLLRTAIDALRRKYKAIDKRLNNRLLPLLSQSIANEPYLRMKNASLLIGIVGLNEATKMQMGKQLYEDNSAVDYASQIIGHLVLQAKKLSLKSGFRIGVTQSANSEAALRFAELDVKRYGWKNIFAQGNVNAPYYTDLVSVPLQADVSLEDRLKIEGSFHHLFNGGHLSIIELEEPERSPEALLQMSKNITKLNIGAYAYTRSYGYCLNCKKVFGGFQQKCPECKTVKNFICYNRPSFEYFPINYLSSTQKDQVNARTRYII